MPELTYVDSGTLLRCPSNIAVCPECGGEILITMQDWETTTRKVIGITIECKSENWNDRATWHPRWGSNWYRTTNDILNWIKKHIRVNKAEC